MTSMSSRIQICFSVVLLTVALLCLTNCGGGGATNNPTSPVNAAGSPVAAWTKTLTNTKDTYPGGSSQGFAVSVDANDNAIVGAQRTVTWNPLVYIGFAASYDPSGNQRWVSDTGQQMYMITGVTSQLPGSALFVGGLGTSTNSTPYVLGVNASGQQTLSSNCASISGGIQTAFQATNGQIYLGVWRAPPNPAVIMTADNLGNLNCGTTMVASSDLDTHINSIYVGSDHILALGNYATAPSACVSRNGYLRKLDLTGNSIWEVRFMDLLGNAAMIPGSFSNSVLEASEGGQTFIYVVGTYGPCSGPQGVGTYLGKFDENGNLVWHEDWDEAIQVLMEPLTK